jgi:hypothetical protein
MRVIHAGSGVDVHVGFLVGIAVVMPVTTGVSVTEGGVVAEVLIVVAVMVG